MVILNLWVIVLISTILFMLGGCLMFLLIGFTYKCMIKEIPDEDAYKISKTIEEYYIKIGK